MRLEMGYIGTNTTVVHTGHAQVMFYLDMPVAAYLPEVGWIRLQLRTPEWYAPHDERANQAVGAWLFRSGASQPVEVTYREMHELVDDL